MYSKKGVIEVQFNWIFVLIVGFIIIAIFTTIIVSLRETNQASTNVMVLNKLDAILSGSETSAGTINKVERLPKTKIEFVPNGYISGTFSKQFKALNVFTPSVLEGTSIITMTLEWSVPYRVTNFLYLTNNKIRYVFVAKDNYFADEIYEMIPEGINKDKYVEVSDIRNKDDDMVRIIFFDDDIISGVTQIPPSLNNMKKGTITALKITDDEAIGIIDIGELYFFEVKNDKFEYVDKSYYIKEETLLGAIFTDDIEIYNTVMESAFKKLNIVSQVYEKKTENLGSCHGYDYYPKALSDIGTIIGGSNTFSLPNIENIVTAAEDLEIQNKNLLKKSCPLIY